MGDRETEGPQPFDEVLRALTNCVSAPILSCLIFSVGFNMLARVFRGY
jgi:hypothetical protein